MSGTPGCGLAKLVVRGCGASDAPVGMLPQPGVQVDPLSRCPSLAGNRENAAGRLRSRTSSIVAGRRGRAEWGLGREVEWRVAPELGRHQDGGPDQIVKADGSIA
jgi:hypothetical protein